MTPAPVYLNTAATGLIEPQVLAAGNTLNAELAVEGSSRAERWRAEDDPAIRAALASFLNAPVDNIALLPNFSWGLNGVVQSLKGTEKVLLYRHDYPSLTEPFVINGFPIRWLDTPDGFTLPLAEIRQSIRERSVDIVALSHVQYNSGFLLPILEIGELCRAHGVRFIIDATQSLGAIPVDMSVQYADVLLASNYKWMNAGFGTGEMFISDDFLRAYPPVVRGFNSYTMRDGTPRYELPARSYEPGHPNLFGFTLLREAVLHRLSQGVPAVAAHGLRLTAMLIDGLKRLPLQLLGPHTTDDRAPFVLLRDVDGLSGRIRRHGIVVTVRGGLVRISMHYYNTEEDVAALLRCLGA